MPRTPSPSDQDTGIQDAMRVEPLFDCLKRMSKKLRSLAIVPDIGDDDGINGDKTARDPEQDRRMAVHRLRAPGGTADLRRHCWLGSRLDDRSAGATRVPPRRSLPLSLSDRVKPLGLHDGQELERWPARPFFAALLVLTSFGFALR